MVSIIIVNYNTGKVLKECIESVNRFENSRDFEIIIVDNFSHDESKNIIIELCKLNKNVSSVFLDNGISFSGANNAGIKASSSDYILVMNPDIIFTEPVLEKLVHQFEVIENLGAICPALLGINGKFQRNYFQRYPTLRQFIFFYSILSKIFYRCPKLMNKYLENQDIDLSTKDIQYVEQIPCAFFMTTREIFNKAEMMDENFKLFFEDVDLSYNINKNHKLAVDTGLKVTHLGGESFKTSDNWMLYGRFIASMHYFFKKHYGFIRSTLLKLLAVTNSLFILSIEYIKKIFGKADNYRIKKHKYLLKLLT
jgi:GT2 family glycosyltransferase